MVPSNIVLDRAVDATDLIIASWIVCDADHEGWHKLDWDVLCKRFQLHPDTVESSVQKMIDLGYVRVKKADDTEQWMFQVNINPHRKIEGWEDPNSPELEENMP